MANEKTPRKETSLQANAMFEPRTILQLVLIDETGDSYYRMRWPGRQVAEQSPDWRVISLDARAKERFIWGENADLLITYQSNDLDLLPLIERRRKLGRPTLAEYNDNFYAPPPASPVYEPWSSPLIWQSYEQIMNASDGVIVTGPGLKELFREKTKKPIHILENHLPHEPQSFESLWQGDSSRIGLGWAGSLGHIADILALVPALEELCAEDEDLILHLMGNESIPEMVRIPKQRMRFTNWGPMAKYYEFWGPVHLGFAPMLDTPYNRCRSDIKAVEMAGLGVLPLLPNALPYQQFIKDTKAPTFDSLKSLKVQIQKYTGNRKKLEEDARRCYDYVKEFRVGPRRTERLELYASLLKGKPSQFSWPMPPGYHEIAGTPKTEMSYAPVLKTAEQLTSQNRSQDALRLVRQALAKNHGIAELALTELRLAKNLGDATLSAKIEQFQKVFPSDIRFTLFKAITRPNDKERLLCWQELLELLQKQPVAYAKFFQRDLSKIFCRHLAQNTELLGIGEELVKYFPDLAELHFHLAHAYERTGNDSDSLRHYRWLLETREKCLENREFFKNTQIGYLRSWFEALEARTKGSTR